MTIHRLPTQAIAAQSIRAEIEERRYVVILADKLARGIYRLEEETGLDGEDCYFTRPLVEAPGSVLAVTHARLRHLHRKAVPLTHKETLS